MAAFPILLLLAISSSLAHGALDDDLQVEATPLLTHPGRILFYAPFSLKSITIKLQPLMEELLARGHKITAVMPHVAEFKHENVTTIDMRDAADGKALGYYKLKGQCYLIDSTSILLFTDHKLLSYFQDQQRQWPPWL